MWDQTMSVIHNPLLMVILIHVLILVLILLILLTSLIMALRPRCVCGAPSFSIMIFSSWRLIVPLPETLYLQILFLAFLLTVSTFIGNWKPPKNVIFSKDTSFKDQCHFLSFVSSFLWSWMLVNIIAYYIMQPARRERYGCYWQTGLGKWGGERLFGASAGFSYENGRYSETKSRK